MSDFDECGLQLASAERPIFQRLTGGLADGTDVPCGAGGLTDEIELRSETSMPAEQLFRSSARCQLVANSPEASADHQVRPEARSLRSRTSR